MSADLDLLKALMATMPDPETIPTAFACGSTALDVLAALVKKSTGTSLYDFSHIKGMPINRDLTLPADVIEVRSKSGRVIQRFTCGGTQG